MSLTIALQQIQMPTWWVIETQHQERIKKVKETASRFMAERKLVVLNTIAEMGSATQDEISEKTGLSRGRLFYVMKELRDENSIFCSKITPCKCGRVSHWSIKK